MMNLMSFVDFLILLSLLGVVWLLVDMQKSLRKSNRQSEAIYCRLQAYVDLVRLLDIRTGLPALSGWAAYSDLLLVIARETLKRKPQTVVECSSGASTLVVARCLQMNGQGHVHSIENDAIYAAKTQAMIDDAGLSDWVTITVAPLKPLPDQPQQHWYDLEVIPEVPAIDFLIVDGPPKVSGDLARYPAMPFFAQKFSDTAVVLLDDSKRPSEAEIARRWAAEHSGWQLELLDLVKGAAKLTRKTAP